jgi:cyclomaltodextrinase / maltogenic alpha-amylase / neopullulanase
MSVKQVTSKKQAVSKKQVTFTYNASSGAKAVYVAGDFNDWQPTAGKMSKGKQNGTFQLKMKLAPGEYQYKFVVDGAWLNDPQAKGQVMNPHGSLNSVIRVE